MKHLKPWMEMAGNDVISVFCVIVSKSLDSLSLYMKQRTTGCCLSQKREKSLILRIPLSSSLKAGKI